SDWPTVSGSGLAVLVIERFAWAAGACTVVVMLAVLFARLLSDVLLTAVAVSVAWPTLAKVTTIVTVSLAPAARVPRLVVTVPPDCVTAPPVELLPETTVAPAGSASVRATLAAELAA